MSTKMMRENFDLFFQSMLEKLVRYEVTFETVSYTISCAGAIGIISIPEASRYFDLLYERHGLLISC